MKKWILLVLVIGVIPLVEAFNFLGQEISILVAIPLLLIVIVSIYFVSKIIFDKVKNRLNKGDSSDILNLPKPDALNFSTEQAMPKPDDNLPALMPESQPAADVKAVRPEKAEDAKQLSVDYISELQSLKDELSSLGVDNARKKLTSLIRKVFIEYLGRGLDLTFEEIEKELKNKNKDIVFFSDNLSLISYGPKEISIKDLKELIDEFQDIVKTIMGEVSPDIIEFKKESFKDKAMGLSDRWTDLFDGYKDANKERKKERKVAKLIRKGERLILKDTKLAIKKYTDAYTLYRSLKTKGRVVMEHQIMNFSYELVKRISILAGDSSMPKLNKDNLSKTGRIKKAIKDGKKLIGKDIKVAIQRYTEIYPSYNKLSSEEKEIVKPHILGFYNKLSRKV
ncbi:MAG: hypothetical protein U9O94_00370 [Nanoarchaeota archaeon]|nr:hypothetical protein [Nanoarchaeota archaeon]